MPQGYCSVPGCDKLFGRNYKNVYPIPRPYIAKKESVASPLSVLRSERRRKWLLALGLSQDPSYEGQQYLFVCGEHFVKGKPCSRSNFPEL